MVNFQKGRIPYFVLACFAVILAVGLILYLEISSNKSTSYFKPLSEELPESAPEIKNSVESQKVPILVLSFFPTTGSDKLDTSVTGEVPPCYSNCSLEEVRKEVEQRTEGVVKALELGSTYHGYKTKFFGVMPFLDYEILETKEFLSPIPSSAQFPPFADHIKILEGIDVCDYVENKGVKEVWIWMYHTDKIVPIESNMAGPHGDISNSDRKKDLPVCKKTYTVYDYNYQRGVAEALEDHGHQIEAVLNFVDYDMFWNKFVNPYGKQDGVNHCGWTHYPPNGKSDYDWLNTSYVQSDCEDWGPEGGGTAKLINCLTWSSYMYPDGSSCVDDGGLAFKIWWMQNIPGKDSGLMYKGEKLRNWWEFIGDFDEAMRIGKSLTY